MFHPQTLYLMSFWNDWSCMDCFALNLSSWLPVHGKCSAYQIKTASTEGVQIKSAIVPWALALCAKRHWIVKAIPMGINFAIKLQTSVWHADMVRSNWPELCFLILFCSFLPYWSVNIVLFLQLLSTEYSDDTNELSDGDCTSPTPVCDVSDPASPKCVQCTPDDNKCPSSLPVCDANTNTCIACLADTDCKDAVNQVCLTTGTKPACVQCTSDAQCGGASPTCLLSSNKCVQCLPGGTGQCTPPNGVCGADGTCGPECTTDLDCSDPAKPVCNSLNTCVQCENNQDCFGANSYCNIAKSTCVTCQTQERWDQATQTCLPCPPIAGCLSTTCPTGVSTCTACDTSRNYQATPVNGQCVCQSGYVNVGNGCVQCTSNRDCTSDPNKRICNTLTQSCVQCRDNFDCDPYGTGVCDKTTLTCVPCIPGDASAASCPGQCQTCPAQQPVCVTTNGVGACVECSKSTDCLGNTECAGCICVQNYVQNDPGFLIDATLGISQTSTRDACYYGSRNGNYDQYISTRNCQYRSREKPYDLRVVRHNFQPNERYYFYYNSYQIPDKFQITLGACNVLTSYTGPGELSKYATTDLNGGSGCPNPRTSQPGNPGTMHDHYSGNWMKMIAGKFHKVSNSYGTSFWCRWILSMLQA